MRKILPKLAATIVALAIAISLGAFIKNELLVSSAEEDTDPACYRCHETGRAARNPYDGVGGDGTVRGKHRLT